MLPNSSRLLFYLFVLDFVSLANLPPPVVFSCQSQWRTFIGYSCRKMDCSVWSFQFWRCVWGSAAGQFPTWCRPAQEFMQNLWNLPGYSFVFHTQWTVFSVQGKHSRGEELFWYSWLFSAVTITLQPKGFRKERHYWSKPRPRVSSELVSIESIFSDIHCHPNFPDCFSRKRSLAQKYPAGLEDTREIQTNFSAL